MFGGRGNDPNAQTENIGDDPIKASNYGLKNLRIVAKKLPDWTLNENSNYDDLEELYGEMISVYRRYIYHVHNIIGGVNQTLHHTNQKEVKTYSNTPKTKQLDALSFLNRELWNTPKWLMEPSLVSEIKSEGSLKTIQNLQRAALNRLLSEKKLNRMLSTSQTLVGNGLGVNDLLNTLFDNIFENKTQPDASKRTLQLNFINQIKKLQKEEKVHPEIKSMLNGLKSNINKWAKKKKRTSNQILKTHFQYCYEQSSDISY